MDKMKAVGLRRYLPIDRAEALLDLELPWPEPGPHDLLVRVQAVSVNPVDTKVRAPKDKIEDPPRVLGWDAAGIVERVGDKVSLFRPGDAVYYAGDITRPGCNAQLHCVDERIVGRKPATLDFAQAAALPLTAITAYEALFDRLGVALDGRDAGRSLLIIGAAGGVGSIAIQLAALAGLAVIATAGRQESRDWVLAQGAQYVVDHHQPLRPQLEALGFAQLDFIANFHDTDRYWDVTADLIAPQGRIVTIVENQGPLAQATLKNKSATHVWEFMFTRPMYQTPDQEAQHLLLTRVADWIDTGKLRHTLTRRLSPICAERLREAHAQLESGTMIGKLVVEGWAF
jgi:zinc-binding alcohol dehydrogenase family protein